MSLKFNSQIKETNHLESYYHLLTNILKMFNIVDRPKQTITEYVFFTER